MPISRSHSRLWQRPTVPQPCWWTLPLLVFGGPYSNIRALDAMRRVADERRIPPARIICTGDVVAYCAEPEETVQAVRDWGCHVIAGNCEEQLAAGAADCGCGFEEGTACDLLAKGWYPFANARVSAGSRDWMASLPSSARFHWQGLDILVVHGGVEVVNQFIFASETSVLDAQLAKARADLVIAGHAGIPFVAKRKRRHLVQCRCHRHAGQRRHARRLVRPADAVAARRGTLAASPRLRQPPSRSEHAPLVLRRRLREKPRHRDLAELRRPCRRRKERQPVCASDIAVPDRAAPSKTRRDMPPPDRIDVRLARRSSAEPSGDARSDREEQRLDRCLDARFHDTAVPPREAVVHPVDQRVLVRHQEIVTTLQPANSHQRVFGQHE